MSFAETLSGLPLRFRAFRKAGRMLPVVLGALAMIALPAGTSSAGEKEVFPGERAVSTGVSKVHARFLVALNGDRAAAGGTEAQPVAFSAAQLPVRGNGIEALNAAINQVPYRSDDELWGRGDYWASPAEFFARGGDCEDYAIAKYAALRDLGVAPQDLRVVVLFDQLRGQMHAGLILVSGGQSLFLDSVTDEVRPWSKGAGYRPIYSLNETGLWFHVDSAAEIERLLRIGGQAASR